MRVVVPTKEEMRPAPWPTGMYKVVYEKSTFKVSGEKQTPMLWITFRGLSDGPSPDFSAIGKKLTSGFALQADCMWSVNAMVVAATGADMTSGDIEMDELVNNIINAIKDVEMYINVEVGTYNGQPTNNVKGFIPVTDG